MYSNLSECTQSEAKEILGVHMPERSRRGVKIRFNSVPLN